MLTASKKTRAAILGILAMVGLVAAPLVADDGNVGSPEAKLVGTWLGSLKVQSQSLRIVFNITAEGGKLAATIDSPDQGAKGIPVSAIALEGSSVKIESKLIRAIYTGELDTNGSKIAGKWSQGGASLPLDLEKQTSPVAAAPEAAAVAVRPQEPKAPFPYRTEEVKLPSKAPGVTLAGTLAIPAGSGPFPAVIFVTGSGAQDRDEQLLGHKPFLVIADYLARRGIMSLRCDDRGVGLSTGDFATATSYDFADDAEGALAYLAARPEAKKGALGIIGHSEGGLIAPIVASRNAAVSFIVLLAGPGLRGRELVLLQAERIAAAQGAAAQDIAAAKELNAKLYDMAMAAGSDGAAVDEAALAASLKNEYLDWVYSRAQLDADQKAQVEAAAGQAAAQLASPWFRAFLALDPAPYLAKLSIPVLALDGSKDLQVPAKEDLAAIKATLGTAAPGGPNAKNALVELEGLNHLFQHAKTGAPAEYGDIEESFAPEALKAIGDWILGL
jgi:Dienelactone hydrolase and related enzymes